jgi:hypothetical protein
MSTQVYLGGLHAGSAIITLSVGTAWVKMMPWYTADPGICGYLPISQYSVLINNIIRGQTPREMLLLGASTLSHEGIWVAKKSMKTSRAPSAAAHTLSSAVP